MKALIVYDSAHGNTEKIASSIGAAISGDVKVAHVLKVDPSELKSIEILIVGSPTYGGRPTPPVKELIYKLDKNTLNGKSVAAFDTRLPHRWVKIFGFAAGKIANSLEAKGGNLLASEGFFVMGGNGPLEEGELERAASWAKQIVKSKD
ncbi:flavodoxin family protein [Chloroflexota bacterium]